MSKGRKNTTVNAHTTGTSKESLIGNLTLAGPGGGKRADLTHDTFRFSEKLGRDESMSDKQIAAAQTRVVADAQEKANTLVHLSQENVDNLNVRFKERANEVLRRNTFQGREQLVLTNRT